MTARPELVAEAASVTFSAGFGGRLRTHALRGLTLRVGGERPAITAVVGESGSGKTTLLRLLLGFQAPTAGTVSFGGRPVAAFGPAERRDFRRRVQAVFQDPFDAFNPFWRVEHPLVAPLMAFGLAPTRAVALEQSAAALAAVGLNPGETIGKYPHQLSGGQRQRVMIARALAVDPSILLADEPVSMVDASLRATILESLWKMNRERGIALVYVTHDLTTAYQVADVVLVLYGGMVMEVGAAEEVIHRPRHPYTSALVEAVPSPDPQVDWKLGDGREAAEPGRPPALGCPFAPRCPHAMPRCTAERPALFRTDAMRAAACFLHERAAAATPAAIQAAVAGAEGGG
ncbi:MAG: ABC transporter ATP-binding protein [Rhodobacteraceae bacterium]|jgi:peptide/nickel transport system ATP-binding protein|nr:ABC transporter ATP-binding protein [Paracoccaceae bacterium]